MLKPEAVRPLRSQALCTHCLCGCPWSSSEAVQGVSWRRQGCCGCLCGLLPPGRFFPRSSTKLWCGVGVLGHKPLWLRPDHTSGTLVVSAELDSLFPVLDRPRPPRLWCSPLWSGKCSEVASASARLSESQHTHFSRVESRLLQPLRLSQWISQQARGLVPSVQDPRSGIPRLWLSLLAPQCQGLPMQAFFLTDPPQGTSPNPMPFFPYLTWFCGDLVALVV